MDCEPAHAISRVPKYIDDFKIMRAPYRRDDGRWDAKYTVIVYMRATRLKAQELTLTETGQTDGDYAEYEVKSTSDRPAKAMRLKGSWINRRFTSASLVDSDNVEFVDCGVTKH